MSITERGLPHVAEADGSLARGVDEEVAFARMELAGSDHLCCGEQTVGLNLHSSEKWSLSFQLVLTIPRGQGT